VHKGSYKVAASEKKSASTVKLPYSEEDVERAFESAGRHMSKSGKEIAGKLEKLTQEIEDFVHEEIAEFFGELN
jgi:hypothetical protein